VWLKPLEQLNQNKVIYGTGTGRAGMIQRREKQERQRKKDKDSRNG
jgi:hypothetical protein